MLDTISLNIPLSAQEALYFIGSLAEKVPYKNGEGLAANALSKSIAGKLGNGKVTVQIKAVDVLVKLVDQERAKGNNQAVEEINKLIKLLKGGIDRKIVGLLLKGLTSNSFKEQNDGSFKTEVIINRPEIVK